MSFAISNSFTQTLICYPWYIKFEPIFQFLTSPTKGHKRTPSDISMISMDSVTSSVSPDHKDEDGEGEKDVSLFLIEYI